jgi:hypothetical protein
MLSRKGKRVANYTGKKYENKPYDYSALLFVLAQSDFHFIFINVIMR